MSKLAVGSVFAGHRIDALVGRGGMGVVYRATQLQLRRTVALKVVAPDLLQDAETRRRFLQECRLAASIDHPHAIPLHYAGEEAGVPYLAMRYVAGDDCRGLVRREGPLAPSRAARIVAQVAGALDAAHAAGLVHRDVKPANVLLAAGDHAYLSDFGLTRHVRSTSGVTRTGHWVGTLDFVAPEQIRGDEVDARADVYALGCLLFFLLTAGVPFPRATDEAKLWAHLTQPPPDVSAAMPEAARFDPVVRRALAKSPDDRYPSAGDLGRAAEAAAAGVRVARGERAVVAGDAAAVSQEPTVTSPPPRSPPPRRRPGALPLAGAAAAVVVAAAVVAAAAVLSTPFLDGERQPAAPAPRATPARSAAVQKPRVVATVRWGSRPNSLVPAADRIWVGAWLTGHVAAIETDGNRLLSGLRPRADGGTVDMVGTRGGLWVLTRGREVLRLDPERGHRLADAIPLTMDPSAIAVGGDDVWVAQEVEDGDAQIVRIDARSGIMAASVPAAPRIQGIVHAHRRLWTLHGEPNYLVGRDPVTLRAVERVALPGSTVGALTAGAGALWATLPDVDQVVRFQPRTGNRAMVSVGRRPVGVTVHGKYVWVAASGSSTIERIAARSMRPVGDPIRVPLNPLAIAVTDEAIWVTCVGENVVARLAPT